jgi:hypothetical protein
VGSAEIDAFMQIFKVMAEQANEEEAVAEVEKAKEKAEEKVKEEKKV